MGQIVYGLNPGLFVGASLGVALIMRCDNLIDSTDIVLTLTL